MAALRALGHEGAEIVDIKRVIGPPLEDVLQFLLQPYGDDRIGEAVSAYRQHYGEIGLFGSALYPGIDASLEAMQQAGLQILSGNIEARDVRAPYPGAFETHKLFRWDPRLGAGWRAGSQA